MQDEWWGYGDDEEGGEEDSVADEEPKEKEKPPKAAPASPEEIPGAAPTIAASQANESSKEKATAMTIEALHNITHFKKWKTAVKKQIAAATVNHN